MYKLLICTFLLVIMSYPSISFASTDCQSVPALYQGRFRPLEICIQQWIASLFESSSNQSDDYLSEHRRLTLQGIPLKSQALLLEEKFPLLERLSQADSTFIVLPGRYRSGVWYSIKALELKILNPQTLKLENISNFTLYSDQLFSEIQTLYHRLTQQNLAFKESQELINQIFAKLNEGYAPLAGQPYQEAFGKTLTYPSILQLKTESCYHAYPWTFICLLLYASACLCFILAALFQQRALAPSATLFLIAAFSLHTILLAARSYILARPPVSNMFETVIYVPWIAVLAGFLLRITFKSTVALLASSLTALFLLTLLQFTGLDNRMDNVQAILDSQYWLIIHVLLVVGSYGAFFLCGILGHIYLGTYFLKGDETPALQSIAKLILQTMYAGVAMLIFGTLLGGVWAAESWGRFWDWDPKESWAFISICIYLLWIHAYIFHRIADLGLAIGSILGLMAITFTWYGVNYLLGAGLHSYGFGQGGAAFYYVYLATEIIFISAILTRRRLKN